MTVTTTGTGTAVVVAGVLTEGEGDTVAAAAAGGMGEEEEEEEGATAEAEVEGGRATTVPVKLASSSSSLLWWMFVAELCCCGTTSSFGFGFRCRRRRGREERLFSSFYAFRYTTARGAWFCALLHSGSSSGQVPHLLPSLPPCVRALKCAELRMLAQRRVCTSRLNAVKNNYRELRRYCCYRRSVIDVML